MDVLGVMLNRGLVIIMIIAIAPAFPVNAQNLRGGDAVSAGRALAVKTCSECHVVVPRQFMRQRKGGAPDFADVANDRSTTPMGLLVFLHTPHASMPNLILSNRESNDVIAYIMSLKRKDSR